MEIVKCYAAHEPGGLLSEFTYLLGDIGDEQVEIEIIACGICHSDIAMLDNDWGRTVYPFVPGHEIVGEIVKMGSSVKNLKLGQLVGLGWFSQTCMHCISCLEGNGNMCAKAEQTIVNRHGGFARQGPRSLVMGSTSS